MTNVVLESREFKAFKAPSGYVIDEEKKEIEAARVDKDFLNRILFKLGASITLDTFENGYAMYVTNRETWGRVGHVKEHGGRSHIFVESVMAKKYVKMLLNYAGAPFLAPSIDKNEQCRDLIADHFAILLEALHHQAPVDWQKSEFAYSFWERHSKALQHRLSKTTGDCVSTKTPLARPEKTHVNTKPIPMTLFGEVVFQWPNLFRRKVLDGFMKKGPAAMFPHKFFFDLCKVLKTDMCLGGVEGELFDEKGKPMGQHGNVFILSMFSWEWLMTCRWNYPYDVDGNEDSGEEDFDFVPPHQPPLVETREATDEEKREFEEKENVEASDESDSEEGEVEDSSEEEDSEVEERSQRPNPVFMEHGMLIALFKNMVERLGVPMAILPDLMLGTPAERAHCVKRVAKLMESLRQWEFKAEGQPAWLSPVWQEQVTAFWKKSDVTPVPSRALAGREATPTKRRVVTVGKPSVPKPTITPTLATVPPAAPEPPSCWKRKTKKEKPSRGYIPPKRLLETALVEEEEAEGAFNLTSLFPEDHVKCTVVLKEIEQSSRISEKHQNIRRFFHELLGKGFEMKLQQEFIGKNGQAVDIRIMEKGGREVLHTEHEHQKGCGMEILDGILNRVFKELDLFGYISDKVSDAISTPKLNVTDEMLQLTVLSLQKRTK